MKTARLVRFARQPDALVLDNSYMTVAEQMEWFRTKWDALHEKNAH